ncbi:hypothetical protein P4050_16515 [Pseudomonas aeruginosa]|nr:hypothetical protein [Pseudomonas aeruginosa]
MQVISFQALDQFSSGVLASPEGSLRNAIVSEELGELAPKETSKEPFRTCWSNDMERYHQRPAIHLGVMLT